MIDLEQLEQLTESGPLVLRQDEARVVLSELRRLRTKVAELDAIDREERARACPLPLVALHANERCPRCRARARAHRNHPSFVEVPRV